MTVCKRWQFISKDSWHSFKNLDLHPVNWGLPGPWISRRRNICITNSSLEKVLTRCGRFVRSIHFSDDNSSQVWHHITQDAIEIFTRLCPNLESLKTDILMDSRGLRYLKSSCSSLKDFCFMSQSDENVENEFLELFKLMTKLNRLWITECAFTGECLSYLPANTIREVYLQNCYGISESNLCNVSKFICIYKLYKAF